MLDHPFPGAARARKARARPAPIPRGSTETTMTRMQILDDLNDAVVAACRQLARDPVPMHGGGELERRESALASIDEILQWRPVASFKAEQLTPRTPVRLFGASAKSRSELRSPTSCTKRRDADRARAPAFAAEVAARAP